MFFLIKKSVNKEQRSESIPILEIGRKDFYLIEPVELVCHEKDARLERLFWTSLTASPALLIESAVFWAC